MTRRTIMRRALRLALLVPLLAAPLVGCSPHVPNRYEMIGDSNLENSESQVTNWFHVRDDADQLDVDGLLGYGACPSTAVGDPTAGGTYWSQRLPELRDRWSSTRAVELVVMLGTNDIARDPTCAAQYAPAMDSVVDATHWDHIFWLNQRTDATLCTSNGVNRCAMLNTEEAAYAVKHSVVTILDYAAHFDGHPEWFYTDSGGPPGGNVRLNPSGSDEFSHWLRDQLDTHVGGH